MRIGVFQDVHANLPALEQAIKFFKEASCQKIVHVGDLLGIGPFPKECLELALRIDEMELIMGNHDYWYAYGLPDPIPTWMSAEEVEHQHWTHDQLGELNKKQVKHWKFTSKIKVQDQKIVFQHYGLTEQGNWFKSIIKHPTIDNVDSLFEDVHADVFFYGHHHQPSDLTTSLGRYVNLGSAGCYDKAEVRLAIVEILDQKVVVEKHSVLYEDNGLMEAFTERKVPARDFIRKVFIKRT